MNDEQSAVTQAEFERRQWEQRALKNEQDLQNKLARKNLLKTLRRPVYLLPIAALLVTLAAWFAINQDQQFAATQAEKTAIETTIRDLGSKECAGAYPTLIESDNEISVQGSLDVTNDIVVFGREMRCVATALPIDWRTVGQQLGSMRDGDGSISAGQLQQGNFTFRWEDGLSSGSYGSNWTVLRSFQIVVTK